MYQAMQSVKVKNDKLEHFGQAGYVTKDNTKVINGVDTGTVDVKLDIDSETYEFDVNDIQGL